jgi:hypothetical protein
LFFFKKHNRWQHAHGWMGVSNNCWKYLSQWGEGFSNVVKIFSFIIFEVNVLWTLIVEVGCSMCDGSTRLLHVNMSNCGFSCECYLGECVCEMSLRPTLVFVGVSMLFKQELIFFTRFIFFYEGGINENILDWILILRWNCW